jgi:hypothetical protein
LTKEIKRKSYYEKPSERKRRALRKAKRRLVKLLEEPKKKTPRFGAGGPGGGPGGPAASAVMPDQVLSITILGEAKHPDRAAFVDREYVSKLNSSGFLSFTKLLFSTRALRWVDGTGQIVGVVAEGGAGGGPTTPGGPESVVPADWKQVEVTQFVVQTFVDTDGKLAKAVAELEKLFSAPAPAAGALR